jgi:hypothetical protein
LIPQSKNQIKLLFDRDMIIHKNFMSTSEFLRTCIEANIPALTGAQIFYNFTTSGLNSIIFSFELVAEFSIKNPIFTFSYKS